MTHESNHIGIPLVYMGQQRPTGEWVLNPKQKLYYYKLLTETDLKR